MKSLIWKECHENLKWALVAAFPAAALAYASVSHPNALTMISPHYLFLTSLFAAVFGGTLGLLQVCFESRGERRALLLHRPLSPTRIFLAKVLAGLGLYFPVVGLPFVLAVGWNAVPGHGASPFRLPLALPWLADILTGVVYYFAAMLAAPREAPWNVSRGLGLATAFACSLIVHLVPEFGNALLAIVIAGALLAVAAWGSFITGGTCCWQRCIANAALAITLLIGLLVGGTAALNLPIVALEILGPDNRRVWYEVDRQGRVLILRQDRGGRIESVTDLEEYEPQEVQGQRVDHRTIEELVVPLRLLHRDADLLGYRSFDRVCVPIENESSSTAELWYYVHDQARLLGYEQRSKRLIGSFGPDGFVPPGGQPAERFSGRLFAPYGNRGNDSPDYLAFPNGVYIVDFAQRTLQTFFAPPAGEIVLTASRGVDQKQKRSLAYILTDKTVHILDEAGEPRFSAPLIFGLQKSTQLRAGQLGDRLGYVVWYGNASWWSRRASADAKPSYLVQYDSGGREIARKILPPLPFTEHSPTRALAGFATPLAGYVMYGGAAQYLGDHAGWSLGMAGGTLVGFTTLMLLSAAVCVIASLLLAHRYAFSAAHCAGWSLCVFLFGPTGLLLMFALREWPARIACHHCRKPRIVTRGTCEHCGTSHAPPAPDGTEIFEPTATVPHGASVQC